jgi:receptor protein-tyrosine kinase
VSIIEQAARRLEELRRSGIEVPNKAGQAPVATASAMGDSVPARIARKLEEAAISAAAAGRDRGLPRVVGVATNEAPQPDVRSKPIHIDLGRMAALGYVTPDTPRAQIADEFRVIKRPLLANLHGKPGQSVERANLIMVTSSVPGEGKTFVSINLAISIAMELDKTVLLVDADVSRPSVLERMGLAPAAGLLDMLTNPAITMADVLMRTNIDKLSILPAGAPHGRATELLASDSMNRLLDELADRYADRIVVFDAPPLLPSTESRVLATHMGQVVMVVEAEQTPYKTVARALATVESCPVVLPLLNKISRSEVGFYYGTYGPVEG